MRHSSRTARRAQDQGDVRYRREQRILGDREDEATGKDQRVTITAGSGLSDAEIEKMVNDAKEHEEEDKKRREQIEKRNAADQLAHSVEKALADVKDKLPADKVSDVEGKVKALREAIESDNAAGIDSGMAALEAAMKEISEVAYNAAGATGGAAGGASDPGSTGAADDGVIDAEFEE
ncbi:MAG: Hsp70 family protein [Polyangiales bacterium]